MKIRWRGWGGEPEEGELGREVEVGAGLPLAEDEVEAVESGRSQARRAACAMYAEEK